ncbi:MAG: OmpA family protein [Bryobacterales bacterium]|nr:OmpA family protein [Bryobacterales bacterium]
MKRFYAVSLVVTLAVALTGLGCATKKFVRESVSPVQQRVDDLEKANKQQDASLAELEKGVSRADERAQTADSRAGAAAREAARANEQAAAGIKDAAGARSLAEQGINRAGQVEKGLGTLGERVESLDNYRLVTSETVQFKLGQASLTDEARQKLDALASRVSGMKRYTIEVQGYTDSTGSPETNLRLSQRRAEAVVRHLTLEGKVPLFRVQTIGYGEASPAADNKTREGREQNRRVEVRLFEAGS